MDPAVNCLCDVSFFGNVVDGRNEVAVWRCERQLSDVCTVIITPAYE